jgi:hypothetical protein
MECFCCKGELYLYLQSEGSIDVTVGKQQCHTTIGYSSSPVACLAKRNNHHLYTRSKTSHKQPSTEPVTPQRNKITIGPLPAPYNDEESARAHVQKWKNGARGLLSRMMWGVLLARRIGCTQCYVDEVDLPIINFLLANLPPPDQCTGTTYTALLKNYKPSTSDLGHQIDDG